MYADIFIRHYVKSIAFKEHNSDTSIKQMDLLRTKGTKFCGISQSSVIPRLKLDDQILFFIDKTKKEVKNIDVTIPGDVRVNEGK